jgi:hypothetical protein
MWIAAPLTKIIVINQRKSNTSSDPKSSYAREFMARTIAITEEKGEEKGSHSSTCFHALGWLWALAAMKYLTLKQFQINGFLTDQE